MKLLALKVISRPDESDTTPLLAHFDASGGLIGRAETARLLLPDPKRMVSRFDGTYYLEDMGSTNPASVNGRTLASGQKVPLAAGDRIRIGHYTIACDFEDASAAVAPAAHGFAGGDAEIEQHTRILARAPVIAAAGTRFAAASVDELWRAFEEGAGVKIDLPGGPRPELMRTIGGMLRDAIGGLRRLHHHALAVFAEAYADARKQAAAETGLARGAFPEACPWDLDGALADHLLVRALDLGAQLVSLDLQPRRFLADLLQPLVDQGGPRASRPCCRPLVTWGSSTSYRERGMAASDFPLTDDLPAFLLINQLVYRGSARPTDLADAIGTGRSNVSKIVRRLEEAGLLLRGPDPRDDRATIVVLTTHGRAVGQRIVDALLVSQQGIANPFTPEEFAQLERLLLKFARAVDSLPGHPLTTTAGLSFDEAPNS